MIKHVNNFQSCILVLSNYDSKDKYALEVIHQKSEKFDGIIVNKVNKHFF